MKEEMGNRQRERASGTSRMATSAGRIVGNSGTRPETLKTQDPQVASRSRGRGMLRIMSRWITRVARPEEAAVCRAVSMMRAASSALSGWSACSRTRCVRDRLM
jgi:hypothetical protein